MNYMHVCIHVQRHMYVYMHAYKEVRGGGGGFKFTVLRRRDVEEGDLERGIQFLEVRKSFQMSKRQQAIRIPDTSNVAQ